MHYKTCEICEKKAGRVYGQKRTFMAKFPLDEERCKKWVKVTGKEDLAYIPIKKLHQLKYVCGKHFRPNDFKKKKTQLNRNAIPSMHLTEVPLNDEILEEFPLQLAVTNEMCIQESRMNLKTPKSPSKLLIQAFSSKIRNKEIENELSLNYMEALILNNMEHDYCVPDNTTAKSNEGPLLAKREHDYCLPDSKTSKPTALTALTKSRKRLHSPEPSTSFKSFECTERKRPFNLNFSTEITLTSRKVKLLKKLKKSKDKIKDLQKKVKQVQNISSPVLKSIIESNMKNQNRSLKENIGAT